MMKSCAKAITTPEITNLMTTFPSVQFQGNKLNKAATKINYIFTINQPGK